MNDAIRLLQAELQLNQECLAQLQELKRILQENTNGAEVTEVAQGERLRRSGSGEMAFGQGECGGAQVGKRRYLLFPDSFLRVVTIPPIVISSGV